MHGGGGDNEEGLENGKKAVGSVSFLVSVESADENGVKGVVRHKT